MLHDPAGELAPETVLDFLVGLGLAQLLEGQRVDPLAENAENRGKNRDGRDRGKHDGSNGAVSHRFEEALREQQQTAEADGNHGRREHDRSTRRHDRSAYSGRGVVPLGYLFSETADDEQSVVDRETQADQRDHGRNKRVDLGEVGDQSNDAVGADDGQTADDQREGSSDDATEDEEQQDTDSRNREHFHALDVVGHRVVERIRDRLQAGELHVDAVDVELRLDVAEVVGHRGVVVSGDRDAGDRVLLGLVRQGRHRETVVDLEVRAVDLHDLVGVVGDESLQIVDDLRLELGVVDGLALRRRVQRQNVTRRAASERAVSEFCSLYRFRPRIVPAALAEMILQAQAVRSEPEEPRHHDSDDGEAGSIDDASPAGEH